MAYIYIPDQLMLQIVAAFTLPCLSNRGTVWKRPRAPIATYNGFCTKHCHKNISTVKQNI